MGSTKVSLILYFLFFLHLQHHFSQATSRSITRLATADPSHVNLPVQSVESNHDGDGFSDKTAELAVVVKRGGRSFGGGGRSFGGGGRSFGGGAHGGGSGGRSKGGRGGRSSGGSGERSIGGRGVFPVFGGGGGGGGGSHHGGKRSSGDRKSVSVWLGLSTLLGLVLGF